MTTLTQVNLPLTDDDINTIIDATVEDDGTTFDATTPEPPHTDPYAEFRAQALARIDTLRDDVAQGRIKTVVAAGIAPDHNVAVVMAVAAPTSQLEVCGAVTMLHTEILTITHQNTHPPTSVPDND